MINGRLLWADDEMELLKAHLLFLEKKGYEVVTVTNGTNAIEECRKGGLDLVLLDEMMPGLSGLETLQRIKEISPQLPVVMVTKSEEEDIMNQAIGQQIADYLIKPVNPKPDTADAEEEHPPQGDCHRGRAVGLSAAVPADCHADYGLPHVGRMV